MGAVVELLLQHPPGVTGWRGIPLLGHRLGIRVRRTPAGHHPPPSPRARALARPPRAFCARRNRSAGVGSAPASGSARLTLANSRVMSPTSARSTATSGWALVAPVFG